MMTHHVNRCKHGVQLGQCRCAAPNKVVRLVGCPASHQDWTEDDHPVKYMGTYGQAATPVDRSWQDREAAIEFMKRVSPIKQEPLATAVASEWADKLLAEGWTRQYR